MVVFSSHQFSSVQSFSCDQLFVTPWSAACQASLCITNSPSLLELMSIESVMSSNHLIFFIKEWVVEELWLKFRGLCPSPIIWARINPHHALNWCFPGGTVVKNPAANAGDTGDTGSIPGLRRSPGGGSSVRKESTCSAGDPGLIPELGRSPGEGNQTTPVFLPREFHGQRSLAGYSPWDRKSQTWLSD